MKKIYALSIFCMLVTFVQAQWTSDRKTNTTVAYADAADIQTSNTNDGKTWIAFYSQHGANYDMRAQLLDENGNRMLGDSGLLVTNKKSGSATFVFNVCVDNNNNLIIAFQLQKGSAYECVAQKISTAGKLIWGAGVDLGAGLSPWPVALSNNSIAFAWTNNGKIDYKIIKQNGIPAWSAYKEFTSTASVSRPQLLANTKGGFSMIYQSVVAFPFYTNLYEQRFDTSGATVWSAPTQVSTLTTASYRYFDVHIDGDTSYVAYYGNPSGSNRFDAYVQKINYNGTRLWGTNGSAFSDYSGNNEPYEQTIYMAKAKNSNYVWAVCTETNSLQTYSGVYAQKFNANTGERYLGIYGAEVIPRGRYLASLAFSNLSLCNDNPVFLVTRNDNPLAAIKLNDDGSNAWANKNTFIATANNSKFRFGFTSFYNGQAVAVWQENKGTGTFPYAQNIHCDGTIGPDSAKTLLTKAEVSSLSIKSVYPNPVQNVLSTVITSSIQSNTRFYITDISGNVLQKFQRNLQQGDNIIQLNVANIKPGSYFIKLVNEKGSAAAMFNKQ